eukprot:SAG11_NODE_1980_length_3970_cov_4.679669_2_plen_320_part_00
MRYYILLCLLLTCRDFTDLADLEPPPSTAVKDRVDRCSLPVVMMSCPYRKWYKHEVSNLPPRGTRRPWSSGRMNHAPHDPQHLLWGSPKRGLSNFSLSELASRGGEEMIVKRVYWVCGQYTQKYKILYPSLLFDLHAAFVRVAQETPHSWFGYSSDVGGDIARLRSLAEVVPAAHVVPPSLDPLVAPPNHCFSTGGPKAVDHPVRLGHCFHCAARAALDARRAVLRLSLPLLSWPPWPPEANDRWFWEASRHFPLPLPGNDVAIGEHSLAMPLLLAHGSRLWAVDSAGPCMCMQKISTVAINFRFKPGPVLFFAQFSKR